MSGKKNCKTREEERVAWSGVIKRVCSKQSGGVRGSKGRVRGAEEGRREREREREKDTVIGCWTFREKKTTPVYLRLLLHRGENSSGAVLLLQRNAGKFSTTATQPHVQRSTRHKRRLRSNSGASLAGSGLKRDTSKLPSVGYYCINARKRPSNHEPEAGAKLHWQHNL